MSRENEMPRLLLCCDDEKEAGMRYKYLQILNILRTRRRGSGNRK